MTRWSVAAVVALVLAMPMSARASGCGRFVFDRLACRDGAAKGLHTLQNPPEDGGPEAFFRQYRDASCDSDRSCNGVCTFGLHYPFVRLAVGEHLRVADGEGSVTCYVCKKAHPARCRKLVRSTSTTTTTAPGVTTTTLACESSFAGSCWYQALTDLEPCDETCAHVGRTCDEAATRDIAGSGGTFANCEAVAAGLPSHPRNFPGSDTDETACGSPDLGVGCFLSPVENGGIVTRVTAPVTTCAALGVGGGCVLHGWRVCACR
jgi:hypothetical protein